MPTQARVKNGGGSSLDRLCYNGIKLSEEGGGAVRESPVGYSVYPYPEGKRPLSGSQNGKTQNVTLSPQGKRVCFCISLCGER